MTELEKQAKTTEEIVQTHCNYSCRLDNKKFPKPKNEKWVPFEWHEADKKEAVTQKEMEDFIKMVDLKNKVKRLEAELETAKQKNVEYAKLVAAQAKKYAEEMGKLEKRIIEANKILNEFPEHRDEWFKRLRLVLAQGDNEKK